MIEHFPQLLLSSAVSSEITILLLLVMYDEALICNLTRIVAYLMEVFLAKEVLSGGHYNVMLKLGSKRGCRTDQ